MRFREFLQLLGLGRGVRIYPIILTTVRIEGHEIKWPHWQVPKLSPKPHVKSYHLYKKFLNKGDWAIDVGAQVGDTAVTPALLCGKEGGVLAFEPNPITFYNLAVLAASNSDTMNVVPIPFACSGHQGSLTFDYGDHWCANGGRHEESKWSHGSAYSISVQTVNLGIFLRSCYSEILPKLKFIKIDAEGMDLEILKSLFDIVEEFHPVIQIETPFSTPETLKAIDLLHMYGYECFGMNSYELTGNFVADTGSQPADIIACPRIRRHEFFR